MKHILFFLIGIAPYSWAETSQPLLSYTLGEVKRPADMPKALVCNISLEDIKSKSDQKKIAQAIIAAQKSQDLTSFHMLAQVPSIHIRAYASNDSGKASSYLLLKDYETVTHKEGPEAKFLITYARDHCLQKLKSQIKSSSK